MATLVAWVPPVVFGTMQPGYSAVRDYISELGAAGAAHATVVNATFSAAGALVLAACVALRGVLPRGPAATGGLVLVSFIGVSWLVTGVVPCDAGCPAEGSASQAVHNLVGLAGYLGASAGLLWLGVSLTAAKPWHSAFTYACGVVTLAALLAMAVPALGEVRGLSQRIGEGAVFAWMVVTASLAAASPLPAASPARDL